MKKLLAILLALLMCAGCLAGLAEAALDPALVPFVGVWELEHLEMGGESLPAALLGECTFVIEADGRGVMTIEGDEIPFHMEMVDGQTTWVDDYGVVDLAYFNEAGQAVFELADEDGVLLLVASPVLTEETAAVEAPAEEAETVEAPAEEAEAAPAAETADNAFLGQWKGVSVSLMGMEFGLDDLGMGEISLVIDATTATLTMEGEENPAPVIFEDDRAVVTDGSEEIVLTIEENVLLMSLSAEGLTMTIRMERVGEAAVEPVAEETPAAETAASDNPYDGLWVTVKVSLMGMDFAPEQVSDEPITLEVAGDKAVLAIAGMTGECTMRYEADRAILNDGYTDAPMVINEQGQLVVEMESNGITMYLTMEREGAAEEAPAAEGISTEPAQMAVCSICGGESDAAGMQAFGDMLLCPDCYAEFFN